MNSHSLLRHVAYTAVVANGLVLSTVSAAEASSSDATQTPSFADKEIQIMDTDKDGKLSRVEHSAGAKIMFVKMDANQDGTVTAMEMDASQKAVKGEDSPKPSMSSADKIAAIDSNRDGMLTAQEHAAGSQLMFDKMDTDADGYLTATELRAGHRTLLQPKAP